MSYLEAVKQIKKNQLSSVFLLYGNEPYFIQSLKTRLMEAILDDDKDNLSSYDLEETSIQDVIADTETFPLFGERKLIIATNAVFLKAKPDKLSFEHDLESLQRYLSAPVDFSVLVLIAPYEKIDERKKITKQLKKQASVVACNAIKEYELKKWISQLADQLHVTIGDDVYDLLESELSTNLHLLESELKKLAMYVGENGEITREIAEALLSHTTTNSSLKLVDAVMNRDLHKAITIYKDLEKMKEEPIALIGLLAFQFRTIFRVKLLKQKGYSQSHMQKQLGVHPYVIKIAMQREKQFSIDTLEYIMDQLADADAAMKQGSMEKELAFEILLYHLTKGKIARTKAQASD
ncbi:DNA polymerase III subunit delta [Virgibacillus salarius]|uniref:DNA polymerase III subunit delta n=1 Tax=Virgibacillus salarius TaxID=447199 RepID=UPI002492FE99|nr:DNA polymerase III subunit delta [Virgibacillus salarius]WBX79088.1 DNA polymerase III subunit delta [Virgibacillus salarius]